MRYADFRRQGMFVGSGVVEAGCKTIIGLRLKQSGMQLSDAGYEVLGIDVSAMIDMARKRVPKGQFRKESFFAAHLPSCVAVTAIGECFSYLF